MYGRIRTVHLDAGRAAAALSTSTNALAPLPGSRAEPTAGIAFVPLAHSARRPTAPLPTALDAFVVLQCAHQRRVSTASPPAARVLVEVLAQRLTVP